MTLICKTLNNDGVEIAYQMIGEPSENPPLIMVIGLSGVKEDWRELPFSLAKDRQVIVLDNRGIGESDIPDGPYSVAMMAEDVVSLIKELGVPKVDLLGQSLGGMISQYVAVQYADLVNKLIIVSSSHGGPNQAPLKAEAAQAFQVSPSASKYEKTAQVLSINFTPEWIEQNPVRFDKIVTESMQLRRSGRGILSQMSAVMSFNLEEEIKGLSMPVLVVHGTDDQLLDYKNGEMLAEKIPDARFSPIQGAGHMSWVMDDGATKQAIENFLNN